VLNPPRGGARAPGLRGGRSPFCVLPARGTAHPCGVLMLPGERAIHADLPHDLTKGFALGLHVEKQPVPRAVAPPAHEALVTGYGP
jgi:hypothetical protein